MRIERLEELQESVEEIGNFCNDFTCVKREFGYELAAINNLIQAEIDRQEFPYDPNVYNQGLLAGVMLSVKILKEHYKDLNDEVQEELDNELDD